MKLSYALEMLKLAGIKALPVPGTNKYTIFLPDGTSLFIREQQLLLFASQARSNPKELLQVIQKAV